MCVHNILCVVCGQWGSVNKLERQGKVLIHGITHTTTPCVCVCARVQVTHSHRKCLTITPALLAARSSTTELTPRSSGFFSSRRHLCPGETTLSHPAHSSISLSPPPPFCCSNTEWLVILLLLLLLLLLLCFTTQTTRSE